MRRYGVAPVVDPVGSTTDGAGRVMRGGSWLGLLRDVRAAYRGLGDQAYRGARAGETPALQNGRLDRTVGPKTHGG